jgi:hypothetical protein
VHYREKNGNMTKIAITIALTLISLITIGQKPNNYIEYYQLTNKGDSLIYFKNDSLAYEYYKKAFVLVDYVHISKLIRGAVLATKQNDFKSVYKFSKLAVIQGAETDKLVYKEFYKWRVFEHYRKTLYYKAFIDSLKYFQAMYIENLNIDYKNQIDSLYYIDQRIIRHSRYAKGNYKIDKSSLPVNLFDLDSLLFAEFLKLIDKYGFPTEKKIGPESFRNVDIIYHHNIRLPQNEKYIELAQKALKEGAFLPRDYAWMYDQSREIKKEGPYFYYGICSTKDLNELMKKEVNKRRFEWGIKPLEAQKIIERKNWITQENLW